MSKESLNAIVTQRIEISPELIVLRAVPDEWELPAFEAGQFAVLGLQGESARITWSDPEEEPPDPGRLIRRAYSIASSSVAKEYLEFYIMLVRSGELTPRLFSLERGDRAWEEDSGDVYPIGCAGGQEHRTDLYGDGIGTLYQHAAYPPALWKPATFCGAARGAALLGPGIPGRADDDASALRQLYLCPVDQSSVRGACAMEGCDRACPGALDWWIP